MKVKPQLWKLMQRRIYDLLSHRYGLLTIIFAVVFITISAFHFGEALLDWSQEKYAIVFNSFSDNLFGISFRERMCLPVPIDVVYTWVNGSDPILISQLQQLNLSLEVQSSTTGRYEQFSCQNVTCLPSNIVLVEGLPFTQFNPVEFHRTFSLANSSAFNYSSVIFSGNITKTAIDVFSLITARVLDGRQLSIGSQNYTVRQAYYTSQPSLSHSCPMKKIILMTNVPKQYSSDQVMNSLPIEHRNNVVKVDVHSSKGVAVIHLKGEMQATFFKNSNFAINGTIPVLKEAYLDLSESVFPSHQDVVSNRFEDNEELRYSLRSLEKFAPWVRHVFIVTNGQIPYWLDLNSPRLTLVTHQEIFPNKSHLPTFSSPAIESHLHRIPGLSHKFLYLNDDVMFGREVCLDDFYTQSDGHKLYLSWDLPDCSSGCLSSWLLDGYCDGPCNVAECEWDGGDCVGDSGNVKFRAGLNFQSNDNQLYGNTETRVYFNLSAAVGPLGAVVAASHAESPVVRVAAVSNKYKVLTLMMLPNYNATTIAFSLRVKRSPDVNDSFSLLNFTADVNTSAPRTSQINVVNDVANYTGPHEGAEFRGYPENILIPKIDLAMRSISSLMLSGSAMFPFNISDNLTDIAIPLSLKLRLTELLTERGEELTEKGFQVALSDLYKEYTFVFENFNISNHAYGGNMVNASLNKQESQNVLPQNFRQQYKKDHHFRTNRNLLSIGHMTWLGYNDSRPFTYDWNERNESLGVRFKQGINIRSEPPVNHGLNSSVFPGVGLLSLQQGDVQGDPEISHRQEVFLTKSFRGRRLLDAFGDSLLHVNRLYNERFGYTARKVPAHMPHLIDRRIMADVQTMFPQEWEATSSHRTRNSKDMQFAFSYYYYLLGQKKPLDIGRLFDEMDTDHSGVLSDRELRTLYAKLYDLPLDTEALTKFDKSISGCLPSLSPALLDEYNGQLLDVKQEDYYDREMPQVNKLLFTSCLPLVHDIEAKFKPQPMFKTTVLDDSQVAFKMLQGDISALIGQLDDIRRNPKKFICLNDNINYGSEEARKVKYVVFDFYESILPIKSQFELPIDYRNRFLHMHDLAVWRTYLDWLRFGALLALTFLAVLMIMSYFGVRFSRCVRSAL